MCGRYVSPDEAAIERFWHLGRRSDPLAGFFKARYNVAPQQGNPSAYVPVVRLDRDSNLELVALQWWLLPHWSKEARIKYSTFNARIESAASAASFRVPFKRRRCLIPAMGWYEWQQLPSGKLPWYLCSAKGEPVAFAGLWDRWEQGEQVIESCSIVVGEANNAVRRIHDRMPCMLLKDRYDAWLDPALTDAEKVMKLLQHAPEETIVFHRVSKRVNDARNEGPELIVPVEA